MTGSRVRWKRRLVWGGPLSAALTWILVRSGPLYRSLQLSSDLRVKSNSKSKSRRRTGVRPTLALASEQFLHLFFSDHLYSQLFGFVQL